MNLAEAFAKKKYRVVLLDGDLRNPSVMKCMGLIGRKERGIAAVLKGQMDWEEALTDCRDLTLKILPGAGSTQNPAGLLRSVRMKTMIESLKEEADLLIIDTPPCGVLSDAALFGGIADGAVLVVHQGTTKDREVRRALEFFEDSQIPVCGYVLNGVQEGTTGYGYSSYGSYGYGKYGYGYGKYGYGKEKERRNSDRTARSREEKHEGEEKRSLSKVSEKSVGPSAGACGNGSIIVAAAGSRHCSPPGFSGTGAVPAEAGGPERAVFLHIQVPHDAYRHAA